MPTHKPILSLLAIDPGARTGGALFMCFAGVWTLTWAGVVRPTDRERFPVKTADLVVIECPTRVYDQATVGSILKLARVVGRYEELFADTHVELVEPRAWKGTIDGDIMLKRIEAALTETERQVVGRWTGGYAHNMLDAIGLGKWAIRQPFMRRAA
jgi:hypothetical protein